jgi:hypothetical protein
MINVTLYPSQAAEYLKSLGLELSQTPKIFKAALVAALNRSGAGAHKQAVGYMAARYAVKRSLITQRTRMRKATYKSLVAAVSGRGPKVKFEEFTPRLNPDIA